MLSLSAEGEVIAGVPGPDNNLLTFNTERSWTFRQLDTGPSTALELVSTVGLKNFVINTTGNMGIGVQHPSEKLDVDGNIKMFGGLTFGSAEYIEDGGSFIINCNGGLVSTGDGVDDLGSSTFRWRNIYATNGVINTSDQRDKMNIQDIKYGLEALLKLLPVQFEWNGELKVKK